MNLITYHHDGATILDAPIAQLLGGHERLDLQRA